MRIHLSSANVNSHSSAIEPTIKASCHSQKECRLSAKCRPCHLPGTLSLHRKGKLLPSCHSHCSSSSSSLTLITHWQPPKTQERLSNGMKMQKRHLWQQDKHWSTRPDFTTPSRMPKHASWLTHQTQLLEEHLLTPEQN